MQQFPYPRLTPWVIRLSIANLLVLLLMMTVFTAPALSDALAFDSQAAFTRPWTFLSYMFVHAGLLHLAGNTLGLVVFGSAVESRMGGRNFLLYYLYCGVGAAVFSLGLSGIMHVSPFVGASGAVLGVIVAFALFWPEAELIVFPLPIPLKARTLALILVAANVVFALLPGSSGIAYEAHVGGALFGYLFFRIQALSRRPPALPAQTVKRVVMVQSGGGEPDGRSTPATPLRPRRRAESDPVTAEMDRVLDKISATGIDSLTPDERRFLLEVSRKKKDGDLQ